MKGVSDVDGISFHARLFVMGLIYVLRRCSDGFRGKVGWLIWVLVDNVPTET